MTSHDVVSLIRKKFHIKKVGHAGTLDPMAVGVLPVCIGKATKLIEYMQNHKKVYRAELTLGTITDTQDKWGSVIEKRTINVNEDLILNTFDNFKGKILQVPPMYSAIKHKGKKLYELAREGISIERTPRRIEIYSNKVIKITNNKILFDIECSKGTYVRTICHDIGLILGCGGHMSFLARLMVGNFTIENTLTVEEIMKSSKEYIIENHLLDLDYPLNNFIKIHVDEDLSKYLLNGVKISLNSIKRKYNLKKGQLVLLYLQNKFVAIGEVADDFIKIKKLFS